MDGATRLAILVDAACLAPDGTPLSGAWAVWRAVTAALSALPANGRWSFRLFGQAGAQPGFARAAATRPPPAQQGEEAHVSAAGGCVLSSFNARDSGCARCRQCCGRSSPAALTGTCRDAVRTLRALLGRYSEAAGSRQAACAPLASSSFGEAATDALAALGVLASCDLDAQAQVRARRVARHARTAP